MAIQLFREEMLLIAAYFRHLSVDIEMKNYRVSTSFVSPEGKFSTLYNFSVW